MVQHSGDDPLDAGFEIPDRQAVQLAREAGGFEVRPNRGQRPAHFVREIDTHPARDLRDAASGEKVRENLLPHPRFPHQLAYRVEDGEARRKKAARQEGADDPKAARGPAAPRRFADGDPIRAATQQDAEKDHQNREGEAEDGGGCGSHFRAHLNQVDGEGQALRRFHRGSRVVPH